MSAKAERRIIVVIVVVPFVGFLAAIALLWDGLVTARDLAILVAMYVPVGFGITIGYHRLLTHRSFDAPPAVRAVFAVLGSMAVEGAVIHWVADHRKHHAFADEVGDPHSPHAGECGEESGGALRGLWHAHMGWFLAERKEHASARRYAPDLKSDPVMRTIDRLFPLLALAGLAIPFAAGFLLSGGVLAAGLTALLWGGLARVFLMQHATWSVNSICHLYGSRPFRTEDKSRNNAFVATVALGEGWHQNHHAFPTSARHGLRRWQLDPSWAVIRGLERIGLAHDVRMPSPAQVAAKSRTAEAGVGSSLPANSEVAI